MKSIGLFDNLVYNNIYPIYGGATMQNQLKGLFTIFMSLVLLSACQSTTSQEVSTILYKKKSPEKIINPYNAEFSKEIAGTYTLHNGDSLEVNSKGAFDMGDMKFSVHEAVSPTRAVYIASMLDKENNKKIYTYHGIEKGDDSLATLSFRSPDASKQRLISEQESPYAWQVNTFQTQNINWNSSFTTQFAVRDASVE